MPDGRPFEEHKYDEYDGDVDGDGGVDVVVDQHLLLPLLCHHHQVLSIWLHLPRANWQFVIDNFLIGESHFLPLQQSHNWQFFQSGLKVPT